MAALIMAESTRNDAVSRYDGNGQSASAVATNEGRGTMEPSSRGSIVPIGAVGGTGLHLHDASSITGGGSTSNGPPSSKRAWIVDQTTDATTQCTRPPPPQSSRSSDTATSNGNPDGGGGSGGSSGGSVQNATAKQKRGKKKERVAVPLPAGWPTPANGRNMNVLDRLNWR